MRQRVSEARLSDEILLLHPSVLKVFLLEERTDRFAIVEEAARVGVGQSVYEINHSLESGSLNPSRVLAGAADSNLGDARLVGVLYSGEAILFTRIGRQRVLAICAEPARFHEVLQTVSEALPSLMQELGAGSMPVGRAKSATEATEIARSYVSALVRSPDVSVDEVTLERTRSIWAIQGSYRPNPLARSRTFQLELDAVSGAVTGFVSVPRASLAPLVVGITIIAGTLLFAWLIFLNR